MLSAAAAAQSSSHAAAAARPRAKRRHVERVHHNQWHAFALDSSYSHRRVRSMHARNLLSRLQHEIHAQRPSTAMQLLALLLRDFSRLRTPLAQVGSELLRTALPGHERIPRLVRFGRRMGTLDKEEGARGGVATMPYAISPALWSRPARMTSA